MNTFFIFFILPPWYELWTGLDRIILVSYLSLKYLRCIFEIINAYVLQISSSERTEKQMIHTKTLTSSLPAIAPVPLPRLHIPAVTSPTSPSTVSESNRPFRRHRRARESSHYQESDITYHCSPLADKASDYEDIWGPDNIHFSTFKPQPPPRSLPFSSLDDFSTKNVSKKSTTTATGSTSPQPDILESSPSASLVSPVSLPDMPINGSLVSKHRFGPAFTGNGADPPSLISPSAPAAVTPVTPAVAEPQTPVQSVSFFSELLFILCRFLYL